MGTFKSSQDSIENIQDNIYKCEQDLMKLGTDLLSSADNTQSLNIRSSILNILRRLIELRFDTLIKNDVFDPTFVNFEYKTHINVIEQYSDLIHEIQPLSSAFVRWYISKLMLSRMSKVVNDRIGDLLQDSILRSARTLISKTEQAMFLKLIITQMKAMISGATDVSLFPEDEDVPEQYRIRICLSQVTGNAVTCYKTFFYILLHGDFAFAELSLQDLLILWAITLKVYAIDNFDLKTLCIRLSQNLLGMDLGNWIACRILLDKAMQVEAYLVNNPPEQFAESVKILTEAHHSFFIVFSNMLQRFRETKSIRDLDIDSLIHYGHEALTITLSYRTSYPERLLRFILVICELLGNLDEIYIQKNPGSLKVFVETLKKLLSKTIVASASHPTTSFEPYVTFMLKVDYALAQKLNYNWLSAIFTNRQKMLMTENNLLMALQLRRSVMTGLAQSKVPIAKDLLKHIAPDEASLFEMAEKCISKGSDHLIVFLNMIGDLVSDTVFPPTLTVALLSLPWLKDPDILLGSKRHCNSIPMLKDMAKLSKKLPAVVDVQVKNCILSNLSALRGFPEWKRTIWLAALHSNDPILVQTALNCMPTFVACSDLSSFNILVSSALDLALDSKRVVDLDFIISGISSAICATGKIGSKLSDGVFCEICASEQPPKRANQLVLPEKVPLLLTSLLNKTILSNLQVASETATLLLTCICHTSGVDCLGLDIMKASLELLNVYDEGVLKTYSKCFQALVKSSLSNCLVAEIKDYLFSFVLHETDQDISLSHSRFMVPFLVICVAECVNEELRLATFKHHFSVVLQFGEDDIFLSFRTLVKQMSTIQRKEPSSLFKVHIMLLCEEIISDLMASVNQAINDNLDVVEMIDDVLMTARTAFGFQSNEQLVRTSGQYLVPMLFLTEPEKQPLAVKILEYIQRLLNMNMIQLCHEYIPPLLCMRFIKGKQTDESSMDFIKSICPINITALSDQKRYLCNLFLIRVLSIDKDSCLDMLYQINRRVINPPYNLTKVLRANCEYLGLLLNFRGCLVDELYFEIKHILLESFNVMLTLLDSDFVAQVAGKLLVVLRSAISVGKPSIKLWITFVQRLSSKMLTSLLPQILISIQPLLSFSASNELVELIFRQKETFQEEQLENFKQIAFVLINSDLAESDVIDKYLRGGQHYTKDKIMKVAIRMLMEECETVGHVVLEKLLHMLDGSPLDDSLAAQLVPALLYSLRTSTELHVRLLAAKCLGRIGAVDPGRLGLSLTNRRLTSDVIIFVDDKEFFVDLFERCWKIYSTVLSPTLIDQIEYSLQDLLSKLVKDGDEHEIMKNLSPECRRDIEPLRKTHLSPLREPKLTADLPIVANVNKFEDWIQQCYLLGVPRVRQYPAKEVFRSLKFMIHQKTTIFTKHILSQMIIRLILENPDKILEHYSQEMQHVLTAVMTEGSAPWIQMAAHVVFSILDTLERFTIKRLALKRENDRELARTKEFIERVARVPWGDSLLVVAAAEKCQCPFRALRWCEQFAIKKDANGSNIFERQHFYAIQRIYSQLQNVDGVLGAYECISAQENLSADEQILAFEARGDYTEALPLYANSAQNQKLQLIKCLLRLNQPQLALSTATSCYEQYESTDETMKFALEASQIEAAWYLRDWSRLETMVDNNKQLLTSKETSWGAVCASIMCSVKKHEQSSLSERLKAARERLVDRLTAMTIEHSDAYSQCYKYIAQLHILEEVDDSTESLALLEDTCLNQRVMIKEVTTKWQARSDISIQCASVLEPILKVRRELLEASKAEGYQDAISQLLIQSSRLARQAGHLQIAWTHLVDAKNLDVNHKDVGMEEARFAFQKGSQQHAIGLLTKLLHNRFNSMNEMFSGFVEAIKSESSSPADLQSHQILSTRKDERIAFAEVQLLRAEYMMKAGAVSSKDLYETYYALKLLDVPSEDLFYRVAVFMDGTIDTENIRADFLKKILDTYVNTLKYGKSHLFHAMPRILTLWLDACQKINDQMVARDKDPSTVNKDLDKRDKADIEKLNKFMLASFQQLNSYDFYTAFPQLVSRIVHSNETVFNALKIILSELICKYPHQCLWQSIAVYRTGKWGSNQRQERCNQVYQVAKNKMRKKDGTNEIDDLIDQYDYVAHILVKIAETKLREHGTFSTMGELFPEVNMFFKDGKIKMEALMGAHERRLSGVKKVTPMVMIPLTEMLEHALPPEQEVKVCHMSQFSMFNETMTNEERHMPEVFIHSVEKDFVVLKSMQMPKRITLRSSDGRTFPIMCKPKDELRKDARFMDVNRMMNSLMKQNADARRRQLMVRTFSVIPLQSDGGILEWISNLCPYRAILQPLFDEHNKTRRHLADSDWFKNWDAHWALDKKISKLHSFFYDFYPLVMAEFYRRQFADPAAWHAARTSYATSTAVMSIIGFVLGLGDRHGENILMDINEGCVVHVDFNLIFNKGETLPVKEVVPFRLTRNMVNGLGPSGVEGAFRKACEATLRVVRENKDTLLTVIQTFVHDPLVEWMSSGRAQQNRGGMVKASNPQGADPAQEAVSLISKRLEGHIVTPQNSRTLYNCPPMSIEGQVAKLIEMASDEKLLAEMYIGWAPFM